jgi:hypothetical protein
VQQEAANELVRRQGHDLLLAFGAIVLPLERDLAVVEGDEAAVRDGDAVGVAGEIGEDRVGPGERRLSILPVIREQGSRFVIPIIRCTDKPPLSCARNIAMGKAIFA